MNIICFGDSITEAAEVSPEQRWPRLLQLKLKASHPIYRVFARGIGGNTTRQAVARFDRDVGILLPGTVLIEFGFNDANVYDWTEEPRVPLTEFADNISAITKRVEQGGGRSVLILNHRIGPVPGEQGNGKSYQENFAPYNACIADMAAQMNLPVIDLPALMTAHDLGPEMLVRADGIHLSEDGNFHYAEMVYAGLRPLLEQ
jgi:acyl-CoA thioesterase-1